MRFLAFLLLPALALAQPSLSGSITPIYTRVTTAPMNLSVDSTQTIQSAIDKIPKIIRHPVVITVGIGTFGGYKIDGFRVSSAAATTGASLTIQGTLITATLGTGTATGTATGGTQGGLAATPATHGTLVDSGNAWTVNALRGLHLEITAGPATGDIRTIESNTATTIVVAGAWSATPTSSSVYAIRDFGTVISGPITSNTDFFLASTANLSAVILANNGLEPGTLLIQKMRFTSAGFYAIYQQSPTNLFLKWCRFDPGGSLVGIRTVVGGSLRAFGNTWPAITGSTYSAVAQFSRMSIGNGMGVSEISLDSNVFVGSGGSNGIIIQATNGTVATNQNFGTSLARGIWLGNTVAATTSGDFFDTVSNHCISTSLAVQPGGTTIKINGDNFNNCATAILALARSFVSFTSIASPGSGNTNGISISDGAHVQSDATGYGFSSTTDITVNTLTTPTTSTVAAFRALSPKVLQDANTQTVITEL